MASNYPSTSKPKKGIGKDFGFQSDPAPRKPSGPRKNMPAGSLTLNRYKKGSDVLVKQMKKGK